MKRKSPQHMETRVEVRPSGKCVCSCVLGGVEGESDTRSVRDEPAKATQNTHDNMKSGDDTKYNKPQPPTQEAKYEQKRVQVRK